MTHISDVIQSTLMWIATIDIMPEGVIRGDGKLVSIAQIIMS